MATILEFRSNAFGLEASTARGMGRTRVGASADILLFTGIRYQRWADEAATVEADSPKAAAHRDQLDIAD